MTETQLQTIERELGVRLPEFYRQTSLDFPFRPRGNDWVYWMYDAPDRVIGETRAPLADGEYDQANWKPSYLVIGESAAGSLFLLDTALGDASPVYFLDYMDYSIEAGWPDFPAFVTYWLAKPAASEPDFAAKARDKNRRVFIGAVVAMILLSPAIPPFVLFASSFGIPIWISCLIVAVTFFFLAWIMNRASRGMIRR